MSISNILKELKLKFPYLKQGSKCCQELPAQYDLETEIKSALERCLDEVKLEEQKELFIGETEYRFYNGDVSFVYNLAIQDLSAKISELKNN